jgi:hypothetical protein
MRGEVDEVSGPMVKPWTKKGGFAMGDQIHRRLSKEFVEEVLEAFNERRMAEENLSIASRY